MIDPLPKIALDLVRDGKITPNDYVILPCVHSVPAIGNQFSVDDDREDWNRRPDSESGPYSGLSSSSERMASWSKRKCQARSARYEEPHRLSL